MRFQALFWALAALLPPVCAQATCTTSPPLSAVGFTAPIPISTKYQLWGPGVSLLVTFSSGASATATVQISNDITAIAKPSTAAWNSQDVLSGVTASTNSYLGVPVYAVRLNVTSYTSGTVTFGVCQLDDQ